MRAPRICGVCDKEHCYWCGEPFAQKNGGIDKSKYRTIDHYPATANRKVDDDLPRGIVWACSDCNGRRGTDDGWPAFHEFAPEWVRWGKPPIEFIELPQEPPSLEDIELVARIIKNKEFNGS